MSGFTAWLKGRSRGWREPAPEQAQLERRSKDGGERSVGAREERRTDRPFAMGRKAKRAAPWLENPPTTSYVGPFRTNLLTFLEKYGTIHSGLRRSTNRLWTLPLNWSETGSKQKTLELYVYEQRMVFESDVVICDNCRVAGKAGG